MRFPHLKLGQRLALSYGTVIVFLIVLTVVGIGKLRSLSETTDDALQDKYPKTILVSEVIDELGVIARATRNTLIFTKTEQLQEQLDDINKAKIKMADALVKLRQRVTDQKSKEILKQISIVHSAYVVNQEDFISLVAQHKMGEAKNLLLVDLHGYQNAYFDLLDGLKGYQAGLMEQSSKEVADTYRTARALMLILAGLAALLSIGITALITRSVLRQLGGEPDYAVSIAREIAAGNLSSEIEIDPNDHASLLWAMRAMRDSLLERSVSLQKVNEDLASTIETLHRAQEELVTSEKLAALGSLVAGIAHELNTPIGNSMIAASTQADLTRAFEHDIADGLKRSMLTSYLNEMHEGGEILLRNLHRAGDMVASFKQVAVDRETSQCRNFSLSEVVAEILLTLQPRIKKTAFVLSQNIPDGITMHSYPGPLGQVITNLINNSILHGFDRRDSGTISIAAQALPDGLVELSVHDDGKGIPPDHLKRIYDPFFTTKLGAGGSGLGLNITYNIVNGILAGKIRVASQLNVGTTFTLTMPADADPA